jgi:GNAT superfamily N-acetyltransferase
MFCTELNDAAKAFVAQSKPLIVTAVEPFPAFLEEVKPILPLHYAELALNQDKVPLSPQYDEYLRRDAEGSLFLVTLRTAGELIGYFVGFVAPGLHYSTCLTLHLDIFYVHPDWRGNGAGLTLFKAVEREAKRRGVQRMFTGSKNHKDASFLFEMLGYDRCETIYTAWLGD